MSTMLLVAVVVSLVPLALIGSLLIPTRLMRSRLGIGILTLAVVLILIPPRTLWHTGVIVQIVALLGAREVAIARILLFVIVLFLIPIVLRS